MGTMKSRVSLVEVTIVAVVAALLGIAVIDVVASGYSFVTILCVIAVVALLLLLARVSRSPDRLRARQSERTLRLAAQTLPYMQDDLNTESAQEVCKLLLPSTRASAVAITDREKILGYCGREMTAHPIGAPIGDPFTMQAIEEGKIQIVRPQQNPCKKDVVGSGQAALCVPLKRHDEVIGVLRFYYRSARQIDANQQAMAEGLGFLLEMQLRLGELEYQRELATKMSLRALQAQINPHFLYNTINTIAALIRTNPAQARILLREFAVFYRQTLESSMEDTTLDKEITQTLRYLGFEKARFGPDKIIATVSVEEGLFNINVPSFIIQPLVENAVAHGRREYEPLHITIDAKVIEGQVVIVVKDDGVGMAESTRESVLKDGKGGHSGVALRNVAERLEGFFGINAGLAVQSGVGMGTCIVLNLGPEESCKAVVDDQSDNSRR